jgi:hypothetical protein
VVVSKADRCTIPVLYPFRNVEHHTAMLVWLSENIDPECYDAEDFSLLNVREISRNIWFAREQDAAWFVLMWT